jgi:hypothetical protein
MGDAAMLLASGIAAAPKVGRQLGAEVAQISGCSEKK